MSRIDFARSAAIPPASSKIANEVRSGAIARIGGLLNCQESAEGTGIKSGSSCMRKRVAGSFPHQPARRGSSRLRRVALVHERARDRARAGVEIFVGTPDREIDVPIVQRERNIAGRVREIDPDGAAAASARPR